MPDGGGAFFLEEFGVRGAAAFTDFLSDGGEELLRSLEYGIAAGIFWSGFVQQGVESFGSAIKVVLIFQQKGFSKSWLGEVRVGHNGCLEMLHSAGLVSLRFCQKILYESKIQCTMIRDFYAKSDSQIVKYQQLIPCILILIVEIASKPFSDFYAGLRSFRLK